MKTEAFALGVKIGMLKEMTGTKQYEDMPGSERERIAKQINAMVEYNKILHERINYKENQANE